MYKYYLLIYAMFGWFIVSAAELDTLESLVKQWTDLNSEIADVENSWNEKQVHWKSEIAILSEEKELLKKQVDSGGAVEKTFQADRLKDIERKERLARSAKLLPPILSKAEHTLHAWAKNIPPLLSESLENNLNRLPSSEDALGQSLSERLQLIISIYTEIEQWQLGLHRGKERIEMRDNQRREVNVLYIGLAIGYAVADDGSWAGIGQLGESGWEWKERLDLAPSILNAIRVHDRDKTAALVTLPMQLKRGQRE